LELGLGAGTRGRQRERGRTALGGGPAALLALLALLAAAAEQAAAEALHHLLHLAELLEQGVDRGDVDAGSLGDADLAGAVDDLRVAALLEGHRVDDALDLGQLSVVDLLVAE